MLYDVYLKGSKEIAYEGVDEDAALDRVESEGLETLSEQEWTPGLLPKESRARVATESLDEVYLDWGVSERSYDADPDQYIAFSVTAMITVDAASTEEAKVAAVARMGDLVRQSAAPAP